VIGMATLIEIASQLLEDLELYKEVLQFTDNPFLACIELSDTGESVSLIIDMLLNTR
jgi:hypothetical protein